METLEGRVVVVTGASSGIGLATAEQLVARGATVVAAARGRATLDAVATDLAERPGRVVPAPLDVTDADAVEQLVRDTVAAEGRIDGWVNAAGVVAYGRFEDQPAEEFDRVLAVNLSGTANGARAVLPTFRRQGSGVLVNVASVLGRIGSPLMSAYVASKFAVRGLSQSLRLEVRDVPDVAVCTVLPGPVDTPLFQHGSNRTGEQVESPSLPMDPHRVAGVIVQLLRHPRREVVVGQASRLLLAAHAVAPGLTEAVLGPALAWDHESGGAVPATTGSLDGPRADGRVSGGWRAVPVPSPVRLVRGGGALVGGAVAAGVAAAAGRARRGSDR